MDMTSYREPNTTTPTRPTNGSNGVQGVAIRELNAYVKQEAGFIPALLAEINKVMVGQEALVERVLIALLADGHVLLEGVPGLAKTLLIKTVAQAIQADFARIQFTPDLLPADLVGTQIYNPRTNEFSVHQGPIFASLILADEINRGPAKVQSAVAGGDAGAPSYHRRHNLQDGRPVPGHGHHEPHRAGGHLPSA